MSDGSARGDQQSDRDRFEYLLSCPRYGCDTWVATTSTVAGSFEAPPACYCPKHDDWVEMNAEQVKGSDDDGS